MWFCYCSVCAVGMSETLILLAGINSLRGLMEVRIWDIRAIDHVLPWHSFWGNCQHQSDEVNERGVQHAVLVHTK